MSEQLQAVTVPDLGLPGLAIVVGVWLVPLGAHVSQGDRVVELLVGDVAIDLSAPVSGVFCERRASEDERVEPGQVLGWIKNSAD
jgi:pyruvate/2-oxoglutarate dehydrogenase complex dihydrolipoamide acyltransferase (E2) component